jgi:hypothetical protein
MSMITIRMTRKQALEQGLLICLCGHPENNHFSHGTRSCARCECTNYKEKARVGELVSHDRDQPEDTHNQATHK